MLTREKCMPLADHLTGGLTGRGAAPARAVSFVGLSQVFLHGLAGGARVVRLNGQQHLLVFANGRLPRFGVFKIIAQPLEQRAVACLQVALNGVEQHAVATCLGNGFVKGFVALAWHLVAGGFEFHLLQAGFDGFEVGFLGMGGGQSGHFGFDQQAGTHDLQRAPVCGGVVIGCSWGE